MGVEVSFYGVRGTRPVSGPKFERYGGATASVGIRGKGGQRLVFDAGTGIAGVCAELNGRKDPVAVFLSHLHHDHVTGLPFFGPLFEADRLVRVFIPKGMTEDLHTYFAPPFYPLTVPELPADLQIIELPDHGYAACETASGLELCAEHALPKDGKAAVVRWLALPPAVHPRNGVTIFSIYMYEKKVVYASDFEWERTSQEDRARFMDFAKGVDLFIVDSQYVEDEYPAFAGRGHNTARTAVRVGERVGAKQIVLYHHDPFRDDDAMDALQKDARQARTSSDTQVFAAWAGMRINL